MIRSLCSRLFDLVKWRRSCGLCKSVCFYLRKNGRGSDDNVQAWLVDWVSGDGGGGGSRRIGEDRCLRVDVFIYDL